VKTPVPNQEQALAAEEIAEHTTAEDECRIDEIVAIDDPLQDRYG
jgi:hypothetical protein